jgi:hypothetical protein
MISGSVIAEKLPSTPVSLTAVGYDDDKLYLGPVYLQVASVFNDGTIQSSVWNNIS